MDKFGKVPVGVHGFELPKFRESLEQREWWKLQKAYTSSPHHASAKVFRQTQRGKVDPMTLADS
jgi:hypothetical protein